MVCQGVQVATQEVQVPPVSHNYNAAAVYMDQNHKCRLRALPPRHEDTVKRAQRKQSRNDREGDRKFLATTVRLPFGDPSDQR
jgi:hypothetical protein